MSRVRLGRRFWRVNRILCRLDALLCRLVGRHAASDSDWGYGGAGVVDRYCANCLQVVDRVPLDDCRSTGEVLDWQHVARAGGVR